MNPLWPDLIALPNLFDAARRAAAGKKSRPDVAAFQANLEPEFYRLHRQLAGGYYRPGPYRTFRILDLLCCRPHNKSVAHAVMWHPAALSRADAGIAVQLAT